MAIPHTGNVAPEIPPEVLRTTSDETSSSRPLSSPSWLALGLNDSVDFQYWNHRSDDDKQANNKATKTFNFGRPLRRKDYEFVDRDPAKKGDEPGHQSQRNAREKATNRRAGKYEA